ncbi:hypothetical protein Tco_1087486 [Tanacetum coccineum]
MDSPPHVIADEARLEKLKYSAKGERKPTFGMPIPEAILRGLMRKGVVLKPKKKKDAAPKRSKSITAEDNVLSNPDEALEYAKQVSIDETKKQEKERQTKHKHAGIWLEQQVNKVVDDGIESKKQAILEEIKRKDTREGLGAPQESLNHSSSSNDSFESATDDKTESERDSDHDDSENDSKTGDESDKSNSNEENVESDKLTNLEQQNRTDTIKELVQANVLNEVRNQLPKLLPKVVSDALKKTLVNLSQPISTPSVDPSNYELKHQLYMNLRQDSNQQSHRIPNELTMIRIRKIMRGRKVRREGVDVLDDEQLHEDHKVQNNEIPRKHNLVWFQKSVEERSKERTYALSITKIKAARYEDEEIEEMIPYLWSPSIHKYNRDAAFRICHWYPSRQLFYKGSVGFPSRHEVYSKENIKSVQSIKVDKRYGYAYLEEIVVTRFNKKEYKFCEADFPFLNQNDIEDLYLMKIQNKICNIKGTKEYDLVNALKMYIYRIVIQKRVEDVKMGVKSYQTKLNLTKPLLIEGSLH